MALVMQLTGPPSSKNLKTSFELERRFGKLKNLFISKAPVMGKSVAPEAIKKNVLNEFKKSWFIEPKNKLKFIKKEPIHMAGV